MCDFDEAGCYEDLRVSGGAGSSHVISCLGIDGPVGSHYLALSIVLPLKD